MSTREAHAAAVRTVLESTGRDVFTYREIADVEAENRPANYLVFDVSRVYGGAALNDGTTGTTLWRVGTRAVATDDDNAGILLDECRGVLEGHQLVIDDELTGPIEFETDTGVSDDDGKSAGLIDWTYDHI